MKKLQPPYNLKVKFISRYSKETVEVVLQVPKVRGVTQGDAIEWFKARKFGTDSFAWVLSGHEQIPVNTNQDSV